MREANLDHHLVDGKPVPIAAADAAAKGAAKAAPEKDGVKAIEATLPRVEFGSVEDFQLKQALNQLKGLPVIASSKAVSAQAK